MRIVTDASVGVKWFSSKNEDNIDLALQIRDLKLKNKIEITVPDLFLFEVINALLKKKDFTNNIIHLALETLYLMNLNIIYPGKEIIDNTIDLSEKSKLTFYDACYMAVALSENTLLITEDLEILKNRNNFSFIKSLSEFHSILKL
ncbi:MAG: type II toxin-antitoxin system VapC family toxin [Actinobacteria bacterium]|nr:type II toxin-antitoxin system VapC family toxin [Actinomycetota bacterium]